MDIITSTTPIWPNDNNDGINKADRNGIYDNTFIKILPLNIEAIIDK